MPGNIKQNIRQYDSTLTLWRNKHFKDGNNYKAIAAASFPYTAYNLDTNVPWNMCQLHVLLWRSLTPLFNDMSNLNGD